MCARSSDFLRSDLAARIRKNAQTVRREYRFSLLRPVRDFATLDADDAVLLQGVVDAWFETKDGLVIVDYKTDRIRPEGVPARTAYYAAQLRAYAGAMARITGGRSAAACCISCTAAAAPTFRRRTHKKLTKRLAFLIHRHGRIQVASCNHGPARAQDSLL